MYPGTRVCHCHLCETEGFFLVNAGTFLGALVHNEALPRAAILLIDILCQLSNVPVPPLEPFKQISDCGSLPFWRCIFLVDLTKTVYSPAFHRRSGYI